MRKVWRVQHETSGIGPYHSLHTSEVARVVNSHDGNPRTPGPYKDGFSAEDYDGIFFPYFGFGSKKQAAAWFLRHEAEILDRAGFCLWEFDTDQIVQGGHQVMFNRLDKGKNLGSIVDNLYANLID